MMADIEEAVLEELQADVVKGSAAFECTPIQYTVFLIDGCFGDICEPDVGYLRFDAVSQEELRLLMSLAMRSGYDMVIREYAPDES